MKIVSIGEVLFDCFQNKKVIGGAPFNFFYHIYKLTTNAEFISRIGNDENGKSIIEFLKKIGLLRVEASKGKYRSSKDEAYKPPDPMDN